MAHGNAQFSHSRIAYGGDSNTSLCSFKAAFPRLPAFYYVFLQPLREEGKISMVSNLQLGKPQLREVKSNHLDNLVKSINVQFSAVSSSLLLSYDVAGLFPPSPAPSRDSPVLLSLMLNSLKRRTFTFSGTE